MQVRFQVLGSRAGFWFLVLGSGFAARSQPRRAPNAILVIPFENPAREARIYWVSEASAVLLADDLNALGKHAHTREERLDAFQRLQVPPVATLSHATVIRLGQVVGATHVVIGSFRLTGANDVGARAEHQARHRTDGARVRRGRPARRSLRDFRARQPAPCGAGGDGHAARTARAAGVRELHQRARRDGDAGEDRLSRGGDQARSRLRSRAACAVERASRRRQRTACARHRRGGSGDLADVYARALQRGAVAAPAQTPRRCVCHVAGRWPIARRRRR